MDAINLHSYEHLSPFEIKDELISLARTSGQATAHVFLNAGRGNPNWIATRAREIFLLLGQFALDEARRVMAHPAGIGNACRARQALPIDFSPGLAITRKSAPAHCCRTQRSDSAFSPTRSFTNWSMRSSATTIPCLIACSSMPNRWCMNT